MPETSYNSIISNPEHSYSITLKASEYLRQYVVKEIHERALIVLKLEKQGKTRLKKESNLETLFLDMIDELFIADVPSSASLKGHGIGIDVAASGAGLI